MTATVVREEIRVRPKVQVPVWRCQYCASGHHGSCPGAVRQEKAGRQLLWLCKCPSTGHPGLHCLECKNDRPDELDPESWRCLDRWACEGRLETRRSNSRVYQQVLAAKRSAAVRRRAKRLLHQSIEVNLDEDAAIDRLHGLLDQIHRPDKKTRAPRQPRVKTRPCECCGEPTKGGRFLPGHDARLVSALVARIRSGDQSAYAEMEQRGWTKKIPAKLRKEGAK